MSLHAVDNNSDTELLTCVGGHTWSYERINNRGALPNCCPQHKRFMVEVLSDRLKPPKTVLQEWAEQAKMLDDEDYAARWRKVWNTTVRTLGARAGSWAGVDMTHVEPYVRALRLAELHRLYAQDRPYIEARGTVKAHPGWELADKEEQKAQKLALKLGLAPVEAAVEPKPKPASQYKTRMQQSAGDHDSVVPALGPDGEAL